MNKFDAETVEVLSALFLADHISVADIRKNGRYILPQLYADVLGIGINEEVCEMAIIRLFKWID